MYRLVTSLVDMPEALPVPYTISLSPLHEHTLAYLGLSLIRR